MVFERSVAVPPPSSIISCAISNASPRVYAHNDQRCMVKRLSASRLGVKEGRKVTLAAQRAVARPLYLGPLERTSVKFEICMKLPWHSSGLWLENSPTL